LSTTEANRVSSADDAGVSVTEHSTAEGKSLLLEADEIKADASVPMASDSQTRVLEADDIKADASVPMASDSQTGASDEPQRRAMTNIDGGGTDVDRTAATLPSDHCADIAAITATADSGHVTRAVTATDPPPDAVERRGDDGTADDEVQRRGVDGTARDLTAAAVTSSPMASSSAAMMGRVNVELTDHCSLAATARTSNRTVSADGLAVGKSADDIGHCILTGSQSSYSADGLAVGKSTDDTLHCIGPLLTSSQSSYQLTYTVTPSVAPLSAQPLQSLADLVQKVAGDSSPPHRASSADAGPGAGGDGVSGGRDAAAAVVVAMRNTPLYRDRVSYMTSRPPSGQPAASMPLGGSQRGRRAPTHPRTPPQQHSAALQNDSGAAAEFKKPPPRRLAATQSTTQPGRRHPGVCSTTADDGPRHGSRHRVTEGGTDLATSELSVERTDDAPEGSTELVHDMSHGCTPSDRASGETAKLLNDVESGSVRGGGTGGKSSSGRSKDNTSDTVRGGSKSSRGRSRDRAPDAVSGTVCKARCRRAGAKRSGKVDVVDVGFLKDLIVACSSSAGTAGTCSPSAAPAVRPEDIAPASGTDTVELIHDSRSTSTPRVVKPDDDAAAGAGRTVLNLHDFTYCIYYTFTVRTLYRNMY